MFNIGIITASDKGSRGERQDVSGATIAAMKTVYERQEEDLEAIIVAHFKEVGEKLILKIKEANPGT